MALAQGTNRIVVGGGKRLRIPATSGVTFYAGSYVRINRTTGLVVKPDATAALIGFGICERQVTGDGLAGRYEVEVLLGDGIMEIDQVNVTGVDNQNDVGDQVWATDDAVLTLTDDTVSTPIGVVSRYYGSGTKCKVLLYPIGASEAL